MNKVAILGRLAGEVELKTTTSGKNVVSFCVAVSRGGKDAPTDWIDCVAWEKTADFIAQYFGKGAPIALEGTIQTRNWEDKSGGKRKSTAVKVDRVEFVPKTKTEDIEAKSAEKPEEKSDVFIPVDDEDLPF